MSVWGRKRGGNCLVETLASWTRTCSIAAEVANPPGVSVGVADPITSSDTPIQTGDAFRKLLSGFTTQSTFKRFLAVVAQILLIPTSTSVAFQLRFDGNVPPEYQAMFLKTDRKSVV